MNCPESLASALQAVATGLPDAANHYFLKANYYDYLGDDQARCWLAIMWLNETTTRNLALGTDELQFDVLLNERNLSQWTRVSIPYAEIWDILHQRKKGSPSANGWTSSLYYDHAARQMPPVS